MKIINSLLTALFVITGTYISAQVTGQLDELEKIEETTKFKGFYHIKKEEGKYKGTAWDTKYQVKKFNNMHDKLSTFYLVKEGTDETDANKGFKHLEPNHYTEPSLFYSSRHNKGWAFVDGLLYGLTDIEDGNNITSFEIDYIFIPEGAGKDKEEKKEKLSLKERMKKAKDALASGGIPKELSDKDHEKILTEYFAAMKPVQEKATANFSPEIKKEIAAINQAHSEEEAMIKKKNAEYWNSPEGRAKLKEMKEKEGKSTKWTIINNTSDGIDIGGSGWTKHLNKGQSYSASCSDNVYFMKLDGTIWKKSSLIGKGSEWCGKTYTIK